MLYNHYLLWQNYIFLDHIYGKLYDQLDSFNKMFNMSWKCKWYNIKTELSCVNIYLQMENLHVIDHALTDRF